MLTQTELIDTNVLPSELTQPKETVQSNASFSTKENEKTLIINALKEANNNKTNAAKLLNITRKTLYNKIKEYDIN